MSEQPELTLQPEIVNGIKLSGSAAYEGSVNIAREAIAAFAEEMAPIPAGEKDERIQDFLRLYIPAISEPCSLTGVNNHFSAYLELMEPLGVRNYTNVINEVFAEGRQAFKSDAGDRWLPEMLDQISAQFPNAPLNLIVDAYANSGETVEELCMALDRADQHYASGTREYAAIRGSIFNKMAYKVGNAEEAETFLALYAPDYQRNPMGISSHKIEEAISLVTENLAADPSQSFDAAERVLSHITHYKLPHQDALKEAVFSTLLEAAQDDVVALVPEILRLKEAFAENLTIDFSTLGEKIETEMHALAGSVSADVSEADIHRFFELAGLHQPKDYTQYLRNLLLSEVNGQPVKDMLAASENPQHAAHVNDVIAATCGNTVPTISYLLRKDDFINYERDPELAYLSLQMVMGGDVPPREYGSILEQIDLPKLSHFPSIISDMASPSEFERQKDGVVEALKDPAVRLYFAKFLQIAHAANHFASAVDDTHFTPTENGGVHVSPVYKAVIGGDLKDLKMDVNYKAASPVAPSRHAAEMLTDFARTVVLPSLLNETPPPYQKKLAGAISQENLDHVVHALIRPLAEMMITGEGNPATEILPKRTLQDIFAFAESYEKNKAAIHRDLGLVRIPENQRPSILLNKHGATELGEVELEGGWKIQTLRTDAEISQHEEKSGYAFPLGSRIADRSEPFPYLAILDDKGRARGTIGLSIGLPETNGVIDTQVGDAPILIYQQDDTAIVQKTYHAAASRVKEFSDETAHARDQFYRMIRQGEVKIDPNPAQSVKPRLKGETALFAEIGTNAPSPDEWQKNFDVWLKNTQLGEEGAALVPHPPQIQDSLPRPIQNSGILPVEAFVRKVGIYHEAMQAAEDVTPHLPFRTTRPEWLDKTAEIYKPKMMQGKLKGDARTDMLQTTTALHTMGVDTLSGVSETKGYEVDVTAFLNSRAGNDPEIRDAIKGKRNDSEVEEVTKDNWADRVGTNDPSQPADPRRVTLR